MKVSQIRGPYLTPVLSQSELQLLSASESSQTLYLSPRAWQRDSHDARENPCSKSGEFEKYLVLHVGSQKLLA